MPETKPGTKPTRGGLLAALALLLAAQAACGSVPQRVYHALSFPMDRYDARTTAAPMHAVRIRVKRFTVGLPYDTPRLVVRRSPFQFGYYNYRSWTAKPQRMLRQLTWRILQSARIVEDVSLDYSEKLPDYELVGEVEALEQFDSGDFWEAHAAMRFALVRFSDHAVVYRMRFDRREKVLEKRTVLVVRVLSRIIGEELTRLVAGIEGAVAADRGEPAGLAPPAKAVPQPHGAPETAPQPAPNDEAPNPDDELIVPEDDPGSGRP